MVDLNAAELGVSQIQLMDSSGHAGAREVNIIAAGGEKIVTDKKENFEIGKANLMREPKESLIISTGITTHIALDVADEMQSKGMKVGVLHMHTIKPLDIDSLKDLIPNVEKIFTID